MTEPGRRFRLPLGTVLAAGLVVGAQVAFHRLSLFTSQPAAWPAVWASVGTGFAAFLVMRWLYNPLWGLVTGLLLPLHSVFQSALATPGPDSWAVLMALLALAGTVAGWLLVFLPRFAWRSWGAGLVMLAAAMSLAWAFHPRTGLAVSVFTGGGLWVGAVLGLLLRSRRPRTPPCWGNITAAFLVGGAVAVGGVFLASAEVRYLSWPRGGDVPAEADTEDLFRAAVATPGPGNLSHGFQGEALERWCWPTPWAVVPLMVWGFWRSLRRGWKLWARRRPPLAWMLTLYAVVSLCAGAWPARSPGEAGLLSLSSVAVLLALFGIADLFRGLMEKLVLAPPEDQDE